MAWRRKGNTQLPEPMMTNWCPDELSMKALRHATCMHTMIHAQILYTVITLPRHRYDWTNLGFNNMADFWRWPTGWPTMIMYLVSGDQTLSASLKRHFNTLRPRWYEQHFADDIFKRIFINENVWIAIKISLKFVPKGPINNIPALVQIMAWRRRGDKPLSEPRMESLLTHICVTRPQWVKWPGIDRGAYRWVSARKT